MLQLTNGIDPINEKQIMREAKEKNVRMVDSRNDSTATPIKDEIKRLLSTKSFESFKQLAQELHQFARKLRNGKWFVSICYKFCTNMVDDKFFIIFEVNGMHIHMY